MPSPPTITASSTLIRAAPLSAPVAGSAVRTDGYTVAAKTGSAEFETGKETHAWFTGFAPVENPKLVVTVLVEEGGSGGKAAAPIARQLFDIYMAR